MPKYLDEHIYHVYNRGAHRAHIFRDVDDYRRLIRLVDKYAKKYVVSNLAYCLMPNHYHFVLRQEVNGSISGFLKTTFNAYTQAINLLWNHSGTLFQGSAKGILIDSDEYALHLIRYIHLNPLFGNLVKEPEDWEYSDYRDWVILASGSFSDKRIGQGFISTGEDYRMFVKEYRSGKDEEAIKTFLPD